ncbi:MAG: hypothetical protein AB1306_02465 [Nitrospirota bacterium]
MASSKEIVPWKCHICQGEFETPSGGICSRCNKATCREHLHQIGQETRLDAKWACDKCLTSEEKARRKVQPISILRLIAIAVIVLLALGFLFDLFSGFYVLRQAKSIYAGLAGLFIVAIFYVIGEAGSEWIGRKDKVNDPLHKRVFRLLVLLIFGAVILAALWFVLKYSGLMTI